MNRYWIIPIGISQICVAVFTQFLSLMLFINNIYYTYNFVINKWFTKTKTQVITIINQIYSFFIIPIL
jgi:hypothetical protein